MSTSDREQWSTLKGVEEDLERNPHLFLRLAENALTVADSVRDNYLRNTARFVKDLRVTLTRDVPLFSVHTAAALSWAKAHGEVVTFIDGGVGQVQVSSRVPILLRVGSYSVRTGERRLAEREQFGYYPIVLGDLEGGSKDRRDFIDIVRIIAELLGGLSALERTADLRVLMFHGPLVYLVGRYAGHTPFTENDIDIFLRQYALSPTVGRNMKEEFLYQAKVHIYPRMAPERSHVWSSQRVFEPLAWMAYLYRRLIDEAKARRPVPIIAGVVERGNLAEFSRQIFERVFVRLRKHGKEDYFDQMYGRTDLKSPSLLVERLGYNDALLMAMLLRVGEYSEPWEVDKYTGLSKGRLSLPAESFHEEADWGQLRPGRSTEGSTFASVKATYVHVSEAAEPIRVEVFPELGDEQMDEAANRAFLYARLLPGYGFPVGLDIADKHAHVPAWLTDAYSKLIRFHLSASLQRGDITDVEMQRILVQAIYTTHRDWLFRPEA